MSFVSYFKLHYPTDPFTPNTAFYTSIQKHNIWKFTATMVKLSRNSNYFPIDILTITGTYQWFKGELESEIFILHMKVITLIKVKSNGLLWYVKCCSCTRRSKTKILTTRALPSWIEFDVVTSQRQTQSASDCVMLLESITWDSQGTWKSTITNHIQDVAFDVNPRWRCPSQST